MDDDVASIVRQALSIGGTVKDKAKYSYDVPSGWAEEVGTIPHNYEQLQRFPNSRSSISVTVCSLTAVRLVQPVLD